MQLSSQEDVSTLDKNNEDDEHEHEHGEDEEDDDDSSSGVEEHLEGLKESVVSLYALWDDAFHR